MTPPTVRTPENGKARWNRSVHQTRILQELHGLVLTATLRSRAEIPMPAEWEHWAEDLRRGRLNVAGSLLRFFDTLARRFGPSLGRPLADEAMRLVLEYLDLSLPVTKVATPQRHADVATVADVMTSGERRALSVMDRGERRAARKTHGVLFSKPVRSA